MKEEINDNFTKKKKKIGIIAGIIILFLILAWIFVCVFDYINVYSNKDPIFCINRSTLTYPDGKVYSCTGLGYKVYKYDRLTYKGYEYGSLLIKDRSKKVIKE